MFNDTPQLDIILQNKKIYKHFHPWSMLISKGVSIYVLINIVLKMSFATIVGQAKKGLVI